MNELPFSGTGNLTHDPELRVTGSGTQVANIRVAFTPRRFNRRTGEWLDGETTYLSGSVWGPAAENVAESLHRGDRVVVTGRLVTRRWTDRDGVEQRSLDLVVDEIGPSLAFARASVTKVARSAGNGGYGPDDVEPPM